MFCPDRHFGSLNTSLTHSKHSMSGKCWEMPTDTAAFSISTMTDIEVRLRVDPLKSMGLSPLILVGFVLTWNYIGYHTVFKYFWARYGLWTLAC